MGTLVFPDGKRMALAYGECIPLGRLHFGAIWGAIHVSRVQCEVEVVSEPDSDAKRLRVVSRSKMNSTVIHHRTADGFHDRVLKDGQVAWMSSGDSLALLSVRPGLAVRFYAAGHESGQARSDLADGKPSKKPKVESTRSLLSESGDSVPKGANVAIPVPVVPEGALDESQRGSEEGGQAGANVVIPVPEFGDRSVRFPFGGVAQRGGGSKPVMLLLVGVQGSGKSTFSLELQRAGASEWTRINQDSIKAGAKGTRKECERVARECLSNGRNCIIDRMNLTRDQRQSFIFIASQLGCKVHVVVLNLDPQLCSGRVANRKDHEGGVHGDKHKHLVRMSYGDLAQSGPPTANEGIDSVQICNSPSDVQKVLGMWKAYSEGSLEQDDPAQRTHWGTTLRETTGETLKDWRQVLKERSKKQVVGSKGGPVGRSQKKGATSAEGSTGATGVQTPKQATNAFEVMLTASRQRVIESQESAAQTGEMSSEGGPSQSLVEGSEAGKKSQNELSRDMQTLKERGSIVVNKAEAEGYLKWDLRCHRCRRRLHTMPILKDHIQTCIKSS